MNRPARKIAWMAMAAMVAAVGLWQLAVSRQPTEQSAAARGTPVRIASLTLATDEILAELVPLERMACVTYLVDDAEISNVAGHYPANLPRLRDSDVEGILALRPDLVCVAPYNSADFLQTVERWGIATYRNEALDSIDQIETGIIELGKRVGRLEQAQALTEKMRSRRQQLAARLCATDRRPGVLFWSAGFTSGRSTTIDDIIREAGGTNLAARKGLEGSAEILPEQVIAMDPEFVLVSRWSADQRDSDIENHALLHKLRAVREGRCLVIDGKYLLSVSQHVIVGAERLARMLHPRLFDEKAAHIPAGRVRQGWM